MGLKEEKNAFISPMAKENYLIKLIKNSFEETVREVIYIDIANPANNPVRSFPIWNVANGRFLLLQIISNICFKLTENFFME